MWLRKDFFYNILKCVQIFLTLIRMTKDEKVLAVFKGLLLENVLSVKKLKKISIPSLLSLLSSEPNFLLIK